MTPRDPRDQGNMPDDDLDIILGTDAPPSLCDNGCGRGLRPAPSAPHKRFCSDACRMQWHSKRRTEAMRLWEQATRTRAQGSPPVANDPELHELRDVWKIPR